MSNIKCQNVKKTFIPCVMTPYVESSSRRRRWQKNNVIPCRMQQRTVQFSDVPWKWWW